MIPAAATLFPRSRSAPSSPMLSEPRGVIGTPEERSASPRDEFRLSPEQSSWVDGYKKSQNFFFTELFPYVGKVYSPTSNGGIHELIEVANQVACSTILVPLELVMELEKSVLGRKLAKTFYPKSDVKHEYVIEKLDEILAMFKARLAGNFCPKLVICGQGCTRCHRPSRWRAHAHGSSSSSSSSSPSPPSPRKSQPKRRCDVDNWRRSQ